MADDRLPPIHPVPPGLKPDNATMLFIQMTHGGVVFSAEVAIKIAEVLCETHYGQEELDRQKPFTAEDKDTFWRVEGSYNRDPKVDGLAWFFVSIDKHNARVTDLGLSMNMTPSPKVAAYLRAHAQSKKPDPEK